jgi:hypothetical protein
MGMVLLAACGPQGGGETGEGTSTGTTETSTSVAEPTTTSTTSETTVDDTGTSTAGETAAPTTGEPQPVGCERLAGGDGVDWYLRCGGASDEYVHGVGVDGAGDLLVAVELRTLDPAPPFMIGGFEVVPGEASDILLLKFSSEGEALSVKHITGPGNQYIQAVTVCADGFVIAGGAPPGTDLGGGPLADEDFIASFDGEGTHRWSRSVPILVESGASGEAEAALYDGFVARYDEAGALQWSEQIGSMLDDDVRKLMYDASDKLVVRAFTGERLVVRVYTDTTQSAEWGTDQLSDGDVALGGRSGPGRRRACARCNRRSRAGRGRRAARG